jgi:pimeloyl-ACP methyl ester carboxylesterase
MNKVTSKDGTDIAFDQSGTGPAVILVASALADRSDTVKLAALLAPHFTVINYDRRGRGASRDMAPYAVEREVEDIEALVDGVGGPAYVFGSSSGAVLALDAANRLNSKIKKLALYEPPFIIDDSRPPMPNDFTGQVTDLVSADRRSAAVKLFFSKAMGIPAIGVLMMRIMPGWSKAKAMAHTLAYDLMIMEGTQAGKPLPTQRWASVSSPALVLTGEKSEAFFHSGARALADMLPNAEHRILKGQHHGSVVMAPKAIASELVGFFNAEKKIQA